MQQNGSRPWDYRVDADTQEKNYLKSTVATVLKEIKNDVHQVIKNRKPLHRERLSFFKKRHMKLQNWNFKLSKIQCRWCSTEDKVVPIKFHYKATI